jgi:hypothetical protein
MYPILRLFPEDSALQAHNLRRRRVRYHVENYSYEGNRKIQNKSKSSFLTDLSRISKKAGETDNSIDRSASAVSELLVTPDSIALKP